MSFLSCMFESSREFMNEFATFVGRHGKSLALTTKLDQAAVAAVP
jgi:hypothetical protein